MLPGFRVLIVARTQNTLTLDEEGYRKVSCLICCLPGLSLPLAIVRNGKLDGQRVNGKIPHMMVIPVITRLGQWTNLTYWGH